MEQSPLLQHAHQNGWFESVDRIIQKAIGRDGNVELEVRFGCADEQNHYLNGISANAYQRIIKRHESTFQWFEVNSEHILIEGSNIRIDPERKVAMQKEVIDKCTAVDWGIRFQVSDENTLAPDEYNQLSQSTRHCIRRLRKRRSFILVPKKWRLDVTEVETFQPDDLAGTISWETELEFTGDRSLIDHNELVTSLFHITFSLLQIIQDSFHPITYSKTNELQLYVQQSRQLYPYLGLVKPKTLCRNDLNSKLFDKSTEWGVTCKADGERALLLFDENFTAFIYTAVDQWRQLPSFDPSNWTDDYRFSIIDGEYDGFRFYAFDLLSLRRTLVKYDAESGTLQERVQLLQTISKESSNVFEVKEYRFATSLDELTTISSELLMKAEAYGPFTIDGLIFTPTKEIPDYKTKTWRSQLKWKMQPTVDAQFAVNPDEKYVYVTGKNDTLIIFLPVEVNLYPGRIAEFAWKKNKLTFVRLRPDKCKPNFMDVAVDIAKSYKEPVTISMMTGKDIILPSMPLFPTIPKRPAKDSINKSTTQKKTKSKP